MVAFIGIIGALQFLAGLLFFVLSQSAPQQAVAAILLGAGSICLGLGILIEKANKQIKILERLSPPKS